jgi:cob(I)alamin adenosyltransferase
VSTCGPRPPRAARLTTAGLAQGGGAQHTGHAEMHELSHHLYLLGADLERRSGLGAQGAADARAAVWALEESLAVARRLPPGLSSWLATVEERLACARVRVRERERGWGRRATPFPQ